MAAPRPSATVATDYAAIHPAAVAAATEGRALVIGWFSRGDGAPPELITTAAPAPAPADPSAPGAPAAEGPGAEGPAAEGWGAAGRGAPAPSAGPAWALPPGPGAAPGRRRGKHAAPDRAHAHPAPGALGAQPGSADGGPGSGDHWLGLNGRAGAAGRRGAPPLRP